MRFAVFGVVADSRYAGEKRKTKITDYNRYLSVRRTLCEHYHRGITDDTIAVNHLNYSGLGMISFQQHDLNYSLALGWI